MEVINFYLRPEVLDKPMETGGRLHEFEPQARWLFAGPVREPRVDLAQERLGDLVTHLDSVSRDLLLSDFVGGGVTSEPGRSSQGFEPSPKIRVAFGLASGRSSCFAVDESVDTGPEVPRRIAGEVLLVQFATFLGTQVGTMRRRVHRSSLLSEHGWKRSYLTAWKPGRAHSCPFGQRKAHQSILVPLGTVSWNARDPW